MRRSDAIAFCDWLTKQESGDWHYRVPTSKESKNISMRKPGIGYWIKDGNEFVWAKSGPISSNSISLEQLNRSSIQDRYNAPNTPPKAEHHRFLAGLIPIVDKLRQAYDLHHDLVELLTSIHKLILDHKRKLENESKYANNDKADLQIKFKEASAQQTALERDLRKIASQRHQLREAVEKKKNLQRQLDEIDIKELSKKLKTMQHTRLTLSNKLERYSEALSHETNVTERGIAWDQRADSERDSILANTALGRTRKHQQISKLQEQINNIDKEIEDSKKEQDSQQNKKKELKNQLVGASEQISKLEKQLENADQEEKELENQLVEASEQVSRLENQLDQANRKVVEAKQQLNSLNTYANEFNSIYESFTFFKSTYSDTLVSRALKRNQILNLDRILVDKDNENTLHDACTRVNDFIKSYTQRLAKSGAAFANINLSIKSDIDKALTIARELARQFSQITLDEDIQKLDYYLNWYLPQLAQNRSFVREDSLLRLYIRYFANALAQHLSYWFPKDPFLRNDQLSQLESMVQHIVETYFDVYVAFALLEERIKGNLSASEGILIVREHRRKNHEIIELKENKL